LFKSRYANVHIIIIIITLLSIFRAYLVYIRPLVEYNSVVWSPYTIHDIETVEKSSETIHKKILLNYVNSPIKRGYDAYIYPVWN